MQKDQHAQRQACRACLGQGKPKQAITVLPLSSFGKQAGDNKHMSLPISRFMGLTLSCLMTCLKHTITIREDEGMPTQHLHHKSATEASENR